MKRAHRIALAAGAACLVEVAGYHVFWLSALTRGADAAGLYSVIHFVAVGAAAIILNIQWDENP